MNASNDSVTLVGFQATLTLRDPDRTPKHEHPHNLNEIQRRAYRIHQRHGGIYGGYTLEEWLEAEHELDEEQEGQSPKEDHIH